MRGGEKFSLPNKESGVITDRSNSVGLPGAYGFLQNHNFRNKFQGKHSGPLQPQCSANSGQNPGGGSGDGFGGDSISSNLGKKPWDNSKSVKGIDHSQVHLKNEKGSNRSKMTSSKKFEKQLQECEKIEETFPANQKCYKDGKTRKNILVAIRGDFPRRFFVIGEQVQKKMKHLTDFGVYPDSYNKKIADKLIQREKENYLKSITTAKDVDAFMSKVRKHTMNPDHQVIFANANTERNEKINLPPEPAIVILNNKTGDITCFKENGEFWTAYRLK